MKTEMKIKMSDITLLLLTYILIMGLFFNLEVINDDSNAFMMGLIVCAVVTVTQIILRFLYPNGDRFLITFACILASIGLAVIYRINPDYAYRQLMWFAIGIAIFLVIVIAVSNAKILGKFEYVYLWSLVIIMPMSYIYGIVTKKQTFGASNWIEIGGTTIQPSEFGKIIFVLYLASALRKYKRPEAKGIEGLKEDMIQLWQPALITFYCLGCLAMQNDFGSALMFMGIALAVVYVATGKSLYVVVPLILLVIAAYILYHVKDHIKIRFDICRDPWADYGNTGYQLANGLFAISAGKWFGVGLGNSEPVFIPVRESDMIFTVICEELGMIFGVGIMIVYFLFFYRGMRASFKIKDSFSKFTAIGFSVMIASQTLVIIGGVFSIIPLTGITLPLISNGGTSMLTIFLALALLQKISEEV